MERTSGKRRTCNGVIGPLVKFRQSDQKQEIKHSFLSCSHPTSESLDSLNETFRNHHGCTCSPPKGSDPRPPWVLPWWVTSRWRGDALLADAWPASSNSAWLNRVQTRKRQLSADWYGLLVWLPGESLDGVKNRPSVNLLGYRNLLNPSKMSNALYIRR